MPNSYSSRPAPSDAVAHGSADLADLTYPAALIGASRDLADPRSTTPESAPPRGTPPNLAGWHTFAHSISTPAPASSLQVAIDAIVSGRMHRRAGAPLAALSGPMSPGDVVVVRLWGLRAPCLLLDAPNTAQAFTLTYGTLPGHPEKGEESFCVSYADGRLTVLVTAFSKADRPITRVGGPVARAAQRVFARRYAHAVLAEVGLR